LLLPAAAGVLVVVFFVIRADGWTDSLDRATWPAKRSVAFLRGKCGVRWKGAAETMMI